MRILYFSRTLNGHDRRFLDAFWRGGVEIGFLALQELPASTPTLLPGVKGLGSLRVVPRASSAQLLAAVGALRAAISGFAPDLVVAGPLHDCAFLTAHAAPPCPWVAQSWAFDVFWENEADAAAGERTVRTLQQVPALFADCSAVVARCRQLAGRADLVHFVMPWGLDGPLPEAGPSRELLRTELGLAGRLVFFHTRGLEPIYAVDVLIQAFGNLLKQVPQACLLLAADGSRRRWVEEQAALLGATHAVRVLGGLPHERLLRLYGAVDVYVSCAASDGTSVSLLEAMAAGLPVIVNDRGGNTEWVTGGENGWVVPFGDVDRLVGAMRDSAALPEARRRDMARANRERIAARADWPANFRKYIGFLRQVAKVQQP